MDQGDRNPQCAKQTGKFAAHNSSTHHHQVARQLLHGKDRLRIIDTRVAIGEERDALRTRTRSHEDHIGRKGAGPGRRLDLHRVWIQKRSAARHPLDLMVIQIVRHGVLHLRAHMALPMHKGRYIQRPSMAEVQTIQMAVAQP